MRELLGSIVIATVPSCAYTVSSVRIIDGVKTEIVVDNRPIGIPPHVGPYTLATIPPWPCAKRSLPAALVTYIDAYASTRLGAVQDDDDRDEVDGPSIASGTMVIAEPYGARVYCIEPRSTPSGLVVTLRYAMSMQE